jgi:tRNA dimethylallyltransferase
MQLYAGLPVITNKITTEEQQGIPHHLLGCIGLHEPTWVVGTFVKRALGVIDDIRSRGRLPILVGGTHYYTQSLLFRDRLAEKENKRDDGNSVFDTKEQWPILQAPTEVLLEELRLVDPVMADRWHPNDRRKIQRSLEIFLTTGRKASDIYAAQRELGHDNLDNKHAMRFPTLLFWVHAKNDVLRSRLDKRVDTMLDHGLLDEVKTLYEVAKSEAERGASVDETRGIWVSIGYKEFKSYAQALEGGVTDQQELQRLRAEAVERTQIATRQYAKRQLGWIRIKLVNALAQADAKNNLYVLDGSDVPSFERDVVEPASKLAEAFLNASIPMPVPTSISEVAADMLAPRRDYDLAASPEKWVKKHCALCGTTCVTEQQWEMHVKSKAHRKLKAKAAMKVDAGDAAGKQDNHFATKPEDAPP